MKKKPLTPYQKRVRAMIRKRKQPGYHAQLERRMNNFWAKKGK